MITLKKPGRGKETPAQKDSARNRPASHPDPAGGRDRENNPAACPECGARRIIRGVSKRSVALGCLGDLALTLPLAFFASLVIEPDKVHFHCSDCGFKWYAGYEEDLAINEAVKDDKKTGCIFISVLFAAVVLYLIFK